jgi:uncharacterized protein YyaL (SSP411 family)
MLYDNALLLSVHGLALRMGVGEADMHERVIDLTLGWLQREMLDPDGGCWSTLDADSEDSSGRKEEGEFYLWTPAEVEAVLGPELASSACQYWSVTDEGNFEGSGRSVLALGEVSGEMDEESLRSKLLAARAARPRPGTDDKVLTAWNGMLLVACSELLGEAAESVGQHLAMGLLQRSSAEDGSVLRTWRGEVNGGAGFLDDHAWAALGLLQWGVRHDLAEPVERALAITARMLDSFADVEGGFWLTTAEHGELPIRQRSESDSAIPGATAVAVKLLASLEAILPEHADAALWRSSAEAAIKRLSSSLKHRGPAYWSLLNAAQDLHNPWEIWHIHHDGNEPRRPRLCGLLPRRAPWSSRAKLSRQAATAAMHLGERGCVRGLPANHRSMMQPNSDGECRLSIEVEQRLIRRFAIGRCDRAERLRARNQVARLRFSSPVPIS